MQMKTGVEQSVYALILLNMLEKRELLQGDSLSECIGASPTYFQKLLRKLVGAGIISSTPGVKGGFKLNKIAEDITVYDVYLAVEGRQSLYSSSGIFNEMFRLENAKEPCLLDDLMTEAEQSWQRILQSETIFSLHEKVKEGRYAVKCEQLYTWVENNKVI